MATNIAAIRPDTGTTNTLLTWLVDKDSLMGVRDAEQELSFQFGLSSSSAGSSGANDKAFAGDWGGLGFDQAAVARANVGLGSVGIGDIGVGATQILLDTDRDGSVEYAFNVVLPGVIPVANNQPVAGNLDALFGDDIAVTRTEFSGGVGYKHWYVVYAQGEPGDEFPSSNSSPVADKTFSPHLALSERTDAHFSFGLEGDYLMVGNVVGDSREDIIAVRPNGATFKWIVHNRGPEALPTTGVGLPGVEWRDFGTTAGTPVLGDWDNDGTLNVGVITNEDGFKRWHLDINGNMVSFIYGLASDQFVIGNFADVLWNKSSPGSWNPENSISNWSTGGVPGLTSAIGIDQPGQIEIRHDTNTVANIGSIFSREPLNVSSGALFINQLSNLADIKVTGGEFRPRQDLNPTSFQMTSGVLNLGKSSPLGNVSLSISGGQVLVSDDPAVAAGAVLSNPIQISNTVVFGGAAGLQLDGEISGTGSMLKSFNNELTLKGSATYSGATLISQGRLKLHASERLPDSGAVDIAAGAVFNLNSFSETVGNLSGAGTIELGTGGAVLTTNSTVPSTITGDIGGTGTIVKQGSSALTITAALSMSGTLQVAAGTLIMNGSQLPANQLIVSTGAVLKGTGTAASTLVSGTLAPGQSPGILRTGNLSLAAGSNLSLEFGGLSAGNMANSYDQVQVTGSVTIASSSSLNFSAVNQFVPSPGQQFTILTNDGSDAIVGSFAGLAEGSLVDNFLQSGWAARLSYQGGDGNDIVLTVINRSSVDVAMTTTLIPENAPGTLALSRFSTSDPDVHDVFEYTLVPGTGATDNGSFRIDTGGFLYAATVLNFESKSSYSIRVRSRDLGGNQFEKIFAITVLDLPELVGLPTINDGSTQRSLVVSLSLTFDAPVDIASGAFVVTSRATGVPVASTYQTNTLASGQMTVTLTFQDSSTRGQVALNDGFYELTVDGNKIRRANASLDANQDGIPGDTYRFGTAATDKFYSLFGDINADRLVDIAEFGQFRNAFGRQADDVGYSILFDYNLNGAVNIDDFGKFRERFGKPLLAF